MPLLVSVARWILVVAALSAGFIAEAAALPKRSLGEQPLPTAETTAAYKAATQQDDFKASTGPRNDVFTHKVSDLTLLQTNEQYINIALVEDKADAEAQAQEAKTNMGMSGNSGDDEVEVEWKQDGEGEEVEEANEDWVAPVMSRFAFLARRPFHPARLHKVLKRGQLDGVIRSNGVIWVATHPEDGIVWNQVCAGYVRACACACACACTYTRTRTRTRTRACACACARASRMFR